MNITIIEEKNCFGSSRYVDQISGPLGHVLVDPWTACWRVRQVRLTADVDAYHWSSMYFQGGIEYIISI